MAAFFVYRKHQAPRNRSPGLQRLSGVGSTILGMRVFVDDTMPKDQIDFVQDGKLIGRIVGLAVENEGE